MFRSFVAIFTRLRQDDKIDSKINERLVEPFGSIAFISCKIQWSINWVLFTVMKSLSSLSIHQARPSSRELASRNGECQGLPIPSTQRWILLNTRRENGLVHDHVGSSGSLFFRLQLRIDGLGRHSIDTPQFTIDCIIINASQTQLIQSRSVKRSIAVPFVVEDVEGSPPPKIFRSSRRVDPVRKIQRKASNAVRQSVGGLPVDFGDGNSSSTHSHYKSVLICYVTSYPPYLAINR